MAGEWVETTLGNVAEFLSGGTPSKSRPEYWDGAIPWVSAKDMKRFRLDDTEDHVAESGIANGTKLVPAGTVLLLTRGMTLLNDVPICVVQRPMAFNQDVKALRPKRNIAPEYLPYLLLGNKERLLSLVDLAGHGTGRLNTGVLKAFDILLPPLSEQQAIAHVLGTLDAKIDLNRRTSATLDAMARALLQSWFLDFDPVRAKAEGCDAELPDHIAALFPDRLVESEFGEIPEGWEVKAIADGYDAVKGVSYKGSGLADSGTPLHNLNSVYEGGGYKYEGIKYYTGDYRERHVVRPGDVIVANTEQGHDRLLIGYAALVPRRFGHGIASHHIYRMRSKPGGTLTPVFLCHLLNSRRMHDVVSGYANGTTVNMLPIDGVQKPQLVVPPGQLIEQFSSFALNCERRREEIISETQALTRLRDALLRMLISGELRLEDPERIIARAGR